MIGSIGGGLRENIEKAKVLLLPYCAKPAWCDYRYTDDCGECGGCTVGELYRMAHERGMIPITITSFEMLRDTLRWCAENGYTYIGHCCYEFFEKRYEIFSKAKEWGAGGVLLDILGTTCYNLGVEEEEKAYHGEFQVELDLPLEDARKVLSLKGRWTPSAGQRERKLPEPVSAFRDLFPPHYAPPKALPAPSEDRIPLTNLNAPGRGGEEQVVELVQEASRPLLLIGPLFLWRWSEEAEKTAVLLRKLSEILPSLKILLLPDYRPRSGGFDPAREVDPPNPHISVKQGKHDLVLIAGVHCYRMDFFIRTIKKHTGSAVAVLCTLADHPEADASVGGLNHRKLKRLVEKLRTETPPCKQ